MAETQIQQTFDASCLILGFTGSLGSGCTFLAEGVLETLSNHGRYYRPSNILKDIAREKNLEPSVSNLQDIGNDLRGEILDNGKPNCSALIELILIKIKTEAGIAEFSKDENSVILIDGIKNEGEVRYLKQFPNFYLISIQADRSIRSSRLVGEDPDKHKFKTDEEFLVADKRDEDEEIPNGQQIKRCNYLADIIINNNDMQVSDRQKSDFFHKFIEDYIQPMRKVRKGEIAHDRPPKIEETLMTMAYCASKRSSCLKRRVGAVIAYVRHFKDEDTPEDRDLQFQVISTGYNDVPAGKPCVFSEWEKCYRDFLQEEYATKFKKCPDCGQDIPARIVCPHCGSQDEAKTLKCSKCNRDLLSDYKCNNPECCCEIFSKFLPGEKEAPGKLLDMCRALHAEENAILGLSGISKMGDGKLVLYTTTFPCNLCANKIVAAGIKTVFYAEPYTMKEAVELFAECDVTPIKFQGIKSSAYFRLYG